MDFNFELDCGKHRSFFKTVRILEYLYQPRVLVLRQAPNVEIAFCVDESLRQVTGVLVIPKDNSHRLKGKAPSVGSKNEISSTELKSS